MAADNSAAAAVDNSAAVVVDNSVAPDASAYCANWEAAEAVVVVRPKERSSNCGAAS